ncbi:MAG: hypothetical protein QNJ63_18020 [Calothrix sp. MO_192.B10]|nr:hypothetical protein [Calothrix sp. MO_192.B10]
MRFEKVIRSFAANIALRRNLIWQYRRIPACARPVNLYSTRKGRTMNCPTGLSP